MTEEEKELITWEKHPGRVAQGRELAALVKKIKEEILSNKEQSTVQSTEQSTEQSSVQSTVQSDYVYCVAYFLHTTLFSVKLKNSSMKNRINH